MQTQLLGQPVSHISFGKGIITAVSDQIVTISFAQGEKKFLYPQAFTSFLTLKDPQKQREVNAGYNRALQAEEAKKKQEWEKQERRRQMLTMKIAPNSQAAFQICAKDAESIIQGGTVPTGCYLSGYSKGAPRIPNRLKPNSACLLTALPEGGGERDRQVLGAFMVNEDFWGEHCRDGMVKGHERYRLCLPAGKTLPYWNYFDHGAVLPRWGNVAFRYFSNSVMQKMLFDMAGLFSGTGQEPAAREFYRYFCEINRLPVRQPGTEQG